MIRSPLRELAAFALLASVAPLVTGCHAEIEAASPQPAAARLSPAGLEQIPLVIHHGERDYRFTVELAQTPDQQEHGLMFRKVVAPNEGMLFPFDPPRPVRFWMKNTLIPLDMVFIRPDGTIARIAVNTVPMSLDGVEVDEPVAAVLELAGGRSVELGVHANDTVTWSGFPHP